MNTSGASRTIAGGDRLSTLDPARFVAAPSCSRRALVWGVNVAGELSKRASLERLDDEVNELAKLLCSVKDIRRLFVLVETSRLVSAAALNRAASRFAQRTTETVRQRTGRPIDVVIVNTTGCPATIIEPAVMDALEHHISNGPHPDFVCHGRDLDGHTVSSLAQERYA